MEGKALWLNNQAWPSVDELIRTGRVSKALVPFGSVEQHGPHLPLSTDMIIADFISRELVKRCAGTILLPSLQFGCSSEHMGFPGTISLRVDTMSRIIADLSRSLLRAKIEKLFIVNGHGGNRAAIDATLSQLKLTLPRMQVYAFTILDLAKIKFGEIRKSEPKLVGHADEIETSMLLAIQPEVVDMSKSIREMPSLPRNLSFEPQDMSKVSFGWNAKELTISGVIGDATVASAEAGKVLLDYVLETAAKTINEL